MYSKLCWTSILFKSLFTHKNIAVKHKAYHTILVILTFPQRIYKLPFEYRRKYSQYSQCQFIFKSKGYTLSKVV